MVCFFFWQLYDIWAVVNHPTLPYLHLFDLLSGAPFLEGLWLGLLHLGPVPADVIAGIEPKQLTVRPFAEAA